MIKPIHAFAVGLMAATALMADYTTIVTKTAPSMQGEKEIFFGTVSDYSNYVMQYAGAGAAIGIVVGLLDPYVMSMYADQEYMLVRTDGKGELESILFIGDKHPSLSEAEIHKILQNK